MWIKICGVTRAEDVAAIVRSGADAIGFNFYPGSRRYISIAAARKLVAATRLARTDAPPVDRVGVFVNADAEVIHRTIQETELNVLQIHGDETIEQIAEIHRRCPETAVIRAFRVAPQNIEKTLEEIDRLTLSVPLAAVLLDALVPGEFGGTGITVDPLVLQRYSMQQRPGLILAGGLNPKNVSSATEHVAVWGIDTASGVESAAGIKDAAMVDQFIRAARAAEIADNHLTQPIRIGGSIRGS
ncbi:MAG: phosphoribosylanthranilate isomerase [Planctomycetaceae bacterium]